MSRISVSLLSVVTVFGSVVAILAADPEPALPTAASTSAEDPSMAAMNLRTYEVRSRIAYKESLIGELIAGRATLAQVSDEFLRLNEDEPAAMVVLRARYPGSGDEERSANNVISFVLQRRLAAAEEARVLERLAREFADRFGHQPKMAE